MERLGESRVWVVLGFMHQSSEPKSLSYWEEVGNPLILDNTLSHLQPKQGTNVEIKKGAEDLKDVSTRTRTRDGSACPIACSLRCRLDIGI
jgi:hypothetical protein